MEFVSRTHIGKRRSENQDFWGLIEQKKIAVIADGVGGRQHGSVASRLAVDACLDYLSSLDSKPLHDDQPHQLVNAIKFANDELITVQRNEVQYADMGSTLSCFNVVGDQLHFSWVGDSRVYKISSVEKKITLLSKDHTLDPAKIDKHLQPDLHRRASSILTQMVGSILLLKPDSGSCKIEIGDLILMCTDGLTDHVPDSLLLEYSLSHPNLDALADKLVDRALDCGGSDNITFILARHEAN